MTGHGDPNTAAGPARALDAVLGLLACPVCAGSLSRRGASLRCETGHSFNIARQGYASLVAGGRRTSPGDDADMVAARERFLATGHYAPIARAIADTVTVSGGLCVDVAGGTGYYLSRVLEVHPGLLGLGIDLSPYAARRAGRAHPRQAAVTADALRRLPVRDGAASCALSVFGPRNPAELRRVLRRGGELVVVTPTARHLAELRRALDLIGVHEQKDDHLSRQLERFDRVSADVLEYRAELGRDDVFDDVRMGPNAHHTDVDALRSRIDRLAPMSEVTVSVTVSRFIAP